jgi:8-oxo-dGTP pyrophosphatase MutT (NUDIX family)
MDLISRLAYIIEHDLPGEVAHHPLSPLHRPVTSEAIKNLTEYKASAVAIVIFKQDSDYHFVLIQRTEYNGKHSGQISFPGGKKEESDVNFEETARRECLEEIGIDLDSSQLLGKLSPVYIPVSGFLVEPFVFYYPENPSFHKQQREVASVFTVPFKELLQEDVITTMNIRTESNLVMKNVPCFNLQNKKIWGATALMINELREVLLRVER